ncbi:MAG: hypothetical protein K2Q20_11430 [Phycisphaerales bacterium]|nr:hypothetical protein [Phycisphaerales bacterium]
MKIVLNATKTYATEANAEKAVAAAGASDLRYFIHRNEAGRFFPVFLMGQTDSNGKPTTAMQMGVHFHFTVVG